MAGSNCDCSRTINKQTQLRARAAAKATTRREAERAASIGTTTNQIAANDPTPPVAKDSVMTRPVNAKDERIQASSYRPVRDKNHDSKIGTMSHAKAATPSAVGAPCMAR